MADCSIGVDFGTGSARAVVVSVENGEELGSCVYGYRGGKDGVILSGLDPNLARQEPREYFRGLEKCVGGALAEASRRTALNVRGIGIDTTGSTPVPVDEYCAPLSFSGEFEDDADAKAWLWKDHTASAEAEEITEKSRGWSTDYTEFTGGLYSSEWFFAKILRLARTNAKVYRAAASFVEHCDLMPAVLTGCPSPARVKRSRCAAGHKAMFSEKWGGLPADDFLAFLDPALSGLRSRLYSRVWTADRKAGGLCGEWAERLGLPEGTPVSCGAFDAHMGAVGAGIAPGRMVKIMGTSSCDMITAPAGEINDTIRGVCGQVEGSIIPGYTGVEAGQSAVGDIFGWFRDFVDWDRRGCSTEETWSRLEESASALRPGGSGLICLDWHNGNRNLLFDAELTGLVSGFTLHTRPEEVYLALIEGTAFGARVIMDRLKEYGVRIEEVIACGGLASKSPLVMKVYASVLNTPIRVSSSEQACARGAAIFGAVAGGCFACVPGAQKRMSAPPAETYEPDEGHAGTYDALYGLYRKLYDGFGRGSPENMRAVMKELIKLKKIAAGRN